MSSLYNEIIKKNYNILSDDISAIDFVKLLCSTSNIDNNTKNILQSALKEIHKKRNEYNQFSMYREWSHFITPILNDYANSHNYTTSQSNNMYKIIWESIPEEVKEQWNTRITYGFRFNNKHEYPYLIHLYDINKDEGKFIIRDNTYCDISCHINNNRCEKCSEVFNPDTNVTTIINKLLRCIKNHFDVRFVTYIIHKYKVIYNCIKLNNGLCKKYLQSTILFTNRNIEDDIIKLRLQIKDSIKIHELIRKRVLNHKLRKFIKLCKSEHFKKLFWSNKSLGGKWMKNKFISK
jgi:hypothetical protein